MSVEESGAPEHEPCPECGEDGEGLKEIKGNLQWGCPVCKNVWWTQE